MLFTRGRVREHQWMICLKVLMKFIQMFLKVMGLTACYNNLEALELCQLVRSILDMLSCSFLRSIYADIYRSSQLLALCTRSLRLRRLQAFRHRPNFLMLRLVHLQEKLWMEEASQGTCLLIMLVRAIYASHTLPTQI